MMDNNLRGPVAPKDPTEKRSGFYIMRNKTICGSPVDGHGVCFIYEDNGRLEASAKLIGSVEDEEILSLMGKTEGFRKLVHSIGVSIKAHEGKEDATFAFQMYGKRDPYGSGTTISLTIPADGMEYVCNLADVAWSDDDNVTGQIRFEFDKPGTFADVSVILYLNDGFEAPPQAEADPINFESAEYKNIISKSLLQKGNNNRIKKAMEKAAKGEDVTIAFIGGSITQGAGAVPINTSCYAYRTFEGFCKQVGKGVDENVHYVKAGIGGTPSELGMLRYEMDVLNDGEITPDIVVVEFAVNDEGDETMGECYDSLVRKIYNGPGKPAVILLFAVFANDWNLEERLCVVGETYNLPMVSTKASVIEQFYLTRDQGGVLSKSQFFYDMFHPTNAGHRIMADGILNLFEQVSHDEKDDELDITTIVPPKSGDFEQVVLVDSKRNTVGAAIKVGDFTSTDKDIQCVERNLDLHTTPEFSDNWMYNPDNCSNNKPQAFEMDVCCKNILIIFKDSASIEVGVAKAYVDGEMCLEMDPHEVGWTHCDPRIIYRSEETKMHHVEIQIKEGYEDHSFTILGFGIVK